MFPGNKTFAFTTFDDTDSSTVRNVGPVYHLLSELGLRSTKSVWPLSCVPGARLGGGSLEDRDELKFNLQLQEQGFEIALHNVRNHDATREVIELGFRRFKELTGREPRIHTNHSENRENIYWGAARLKMPTSRVVYEIASWIRPAYVSKGHVEGSPFFWGDLCRERITYVRNFVFDDINLMTVNPSMPYHDPAKPYVSYWFSSSDGGNVERFNRITGEANQDRLEEQGGVCIMYAHFASGFVNGDRLNPRFEQLMRRLAKMNGWFVPVSELLDFLRRHKSDCNIPSAELATLENRWLRYKLRVGRT
jgi:hypothetical protein